MFKCEINDDEHEEIITYYDSKDFIYQDNQEPVLRKFKCITAYMGLLTSQSKMPTMHGVYSMQVQIWHMV